MRLAGPLRAQALPGERRVALTLHQHLAPAHAGLGVLDARLDHDRAEASEQRDLGDARPHVALPLSLPPVRKCLSRTRGDHL